MLVVGVAVVLGNILVSVIDAVFGLLTETAFAFFMLVTDNQRSLAFIHI